MKYDLLFCPAYIIVVIAPLLLLTLISSESTQGNVRLTCSVNMAIAASLIWFIHRSRRTQPGSVLEVCRAILARSVAKEYSCEPVI